jgi:hypothetical protein
MSFVRPGWAGESLRFSAEFFGITMSYHPKVSMIIIQKNRAANRGNPVVDLYDAAGRQSVGLCSLGNDFYRPTSFGSVARPSTMTPTATFGSLATTPADTLERCCTPSGNNSDLTLRAPGTSARTSAFVGRGIQSPPTDLGLRCPRLITLRHVVLHRVNSRILAPTLLMHVRYYQTSL